MELKNRHIYVAKFFLVYALVRERRWPGGCCLSIPRVRDTSTKYCGSGRGAQNLVLAGWFFIHVPRACASLNA